MFDMEMTDVLLLNESTQANVADVATTASSYDNASTFRAVGVSIGIFDIIIGSIGNFLTILAIARNKKMHKPFHIFIANLCVIDFLTASTMMPFNVTAYYTQTWPFGEDDFTCTFMAYSYYCCGYSSIVCLLVITVNRFVGVVYPDKYVRLFTRNRIILMIIFSWLFAPLFLAPVFFFEGGGYGWNQNETLCVFLKKQFTPSQRNYMQFIRVLFQFLPLLVMIILYTKIFQTSRQSRRAVTRMSIKSHSASGFSGRHWQRNPSQSSPSQSRGLISGHVTSKTNETTSLQLITPEPIDDKPCKVNVADSVVCTARPDAHSDELVFCEGDSIRNGKSLEKNGLFSNSESQLFKNDLAWQGKDDGFVMATKSHLRHLLSGKSISVPSSPALGVRKQGIESATSTISISRSRSEANSYKNILGSHPSNASSKLSVGPLMKSKWSSKGNKYVTAIKMEERKRKKMDRRLLRISVTICATFTILFLPSVIVNFVSTPNSRYHMFASFITWLNSCVNPIIYSFMNANMRSQYKLLLIKFWNVTCRCLKIEDHQRRVPSQKSFHTSSVSARSRRGVDV